MITDVKSAREKTDDALNELDAHCDRAHGDVAPAIGLFAFVLVAAVRELEESLAHIEGARL